jgi:hypothetical protein
MKKTYFCLIVLILMLVGIPITDAQGIITGGISGTVVDQTGAIIPGATADAIGESTGAKFHVTTNSAGVFQISDVPLGSYTISVTAPGFGSATINHVSVAAGNVTSVGKQSLNLGSTAQTVEVEAGAAQIDTESAQVETTIDAVQLTSAPVTGAIDNLALMVPGVVNTHDDGMSNTNGANFSVNGERGRSNNAEIDGQTNNDTSIGGPSFFFDNQDALAELQVITTDPGAQYGRNMGAIVNYITKQGTNRFHGSGFEIYTGSWLSSLLQTQKDEQFGFCAPGVSASTGCTPVRVPRFVQNNWGGTLGGPILKDKLFFFGSTLWSRTYESGVLDTSDPNLLPDPNGLTQLASAFPNNPAVAALTTTGPYSNSGGNPAPVPGTTSTIAVTDGATTANIEVAEIQRTFPTAIYDQEHLGRLDYNLGTKDRFYLRYNYQNNPYNPALYLVSAATAAAGGYPNVQGVTHEAGGDWTHTFTPRIINQLRYAFQQSNIAFEAGAIPSCTISNFASCTSSVTLGAPLSGYGYGGNLPQGRFVKVNQVQDNATWTIGKQVIMFGGEFDYQDSPWGFLPNAQGSFNFAPGAASYSSGANAGSIIPFRYPAGTTAAQQASLDNGLTGMLEGVAEVSLAAGKTTVPFKEHDFAFYLQDNYKVNSELTLNLGLRWEYFSPGANFVHNETVAQQTGPNPFWSTSLPLSATTTPAVNSDYRNFEPRLGLSFSPTSRMVVHAGYSIQVDPEFYELFIDMATSAPAVNAGNFGCDGMTVQCLPAGGLTFSTVQTADVKNLPTGGDPRVNPIQTVPTNLRNPMSQTYNLGVQYQLFPAAVMDVRYVGNHTSGNFQALNANPDVAAVQAGFPGYGAGTTVCTTAGATGLGRTNCNYSELEEYANTGFSIYNALQASLTLRNYHGFTGTASYTYSRAIDNASEFASSGSGGTTSAFAQNPLDTDSGERGVSGNSYPNIWGIQTTYQEPYFSKQGGMLGRVLGGYFANAFFQYNGGQPFNPIQNYDSVQSTPVINAITANPAINATQAEYGFCDVGFTESFGFNPCRPVLSNPSAPRNSIGINLGPGGYVDYVTGALTTPSAEHWLWNNQYEAIAKNNPFPGVGRNILRGDSFLDLDMSVGKSFNITEGIAAKIQVTAFNVLNRAYYGTPDPNIEDSLSGVFLSGQGGFGTTSESAAGGGSFPQGLGNRNVQLQGKITF